MTYVDLNQKYISLINIVIEATDNLAKILHYFQNYILNLMHTSDLVTWPQGTKVLTSMQMQAQTFLGLKHI